MTELLTVPELAKLLKISPRTIYDRVAPSAKNPFPIKPTRVGRSVRFPKAKVEEYINGSD